MTKTRKDGSRGRLRIDYGDHRDPQAAIAWLWKFVDGAKTAGELYGRALVVIAAEQYATRLVVPASQRMPATRWSSHKDLAAKALRKLAGPHVPASLTQARAGRQARPQRLREGRDRAARSPAHGRAEPPRRSTTTRPRTSPTPRSRSARARADPPPEDGTPWRACGRRGIGPRTGRRPRDTKEHPRCRAIETAVP